MNMLELTKAKLDEYNALSPGLNTYTQKIINAIPYTTVHPRMKAVIAVSQLTTFAAQFRRNVILWDDTSVPVNAISFVITGSGGGKDSSVKAARKCFSSGYTLIDATRKQQAIQQAIKAAENAGEDQANEFDVYKNYLLPVPPIDIQPTTGPGLIQHINDISKLDISSGFLYSGEFSDELAYNQDMMEDIKIISEIYDTGDKEMKYTKGAEHRSEAIEGQPINALLVGSPGHLLYDPVTRKKFDVAYMSKLARRSSLCYVPEQIPEPYFDSIDAMLEYEEKIEVAAKQAREAMKDEILDITKANLKKAQHHLSVNEEVFKLFKTYKRYNSDLADTYHNQNSTYVLIRRHLQWKAIKLATAYAIMRKKDVVEAEDYVDAIRFCELLDKDMETFEYDLNKSGHERFSDYIRNEVTPDGIATMSAHDIKKQGFISTVSKAKLQELVTLCSGYDTTGVYSVENEGATIRYEVIIKTDVLGISYKPIDNTALNAALSRGATTEEIRKLKHDISLTTAYGYETDDTTFPKLERVLQGDYAYSPFKFRNGVRGKDNIMGGTKWLVLDIDDSPISATEAHFMLSDINHHVALSSNAANDYKFRVLIELDSYVDLDSITWKYFYQAVAHDLALNVDVLPQSQIFFSYAGRPILSVTDSSPLEAREYIIAAKERAASTPVAKPVTSTQKQSLLADPLETFSYCFEATPGTGSRSMIRLAYHAKDLGCTLDEVKSLLDEVQDYWQFPMEEQRYQGIVNQVTRMF